MLAVLEEPAIRARVPAMSVDQYHRAFAHGLIPEDVELIRGALVQKMPKSPLHASIVELLRDYIVTFLPQDLFLRQGQPLTLKDSEPEPDLAVVQGSRRDFLASHPKSAVLVVEVSVTSEAIDLVKLEVYAEAGVPECWLVLAEERVVERHTGPGGGRYATVERAAFPAALASTVIPRLKLLTAEACPA